MQNLELKLDENKNPLSGTCEYGDNGLLFVIEYKNGLIDGQQKVFNQEKQKYSTSFYVQGVQNGHEVFYYEDNDNQKKLEQNWVDGNLEGVATWFYRNGAKEAQVSYIKNKRNGVELHWHNDGKKSSESTFLNGLQTGEAITWFLNGDKESHSTWNNGLKQGIEKYWHIGSATVRIEINYLNNVQHGMKVVRDAAGIVISEEEWVNGALKQHN